MELFPTVIHFLIQGPMAVHTREIDWWKTLNPCYEIHLHDTCEIETHPIFGTQYGKYLDRQEAFRFGILAQHGGWFFPPGLWPKTPLSQLEVGVDSQELVVALTPQTGVTCLGSRKGIERSFGAYLQIKDQPEFFLPLIRVLSQDAMVFEPPF